MAIFLQSRIHDNFFKNLDLLHGCIGIVIGALAHWLGLKIE